MIKFTGTIIITNEGVKGKEDNVFEKAYSCCKKIDFENNNYPNTEELCKYLTIQWEKAESNRKEYFLDDSLEDLITCFHDGDKIEGYIKDNLIVFTKIKN